MADRFRLLRTLREPTTAIHRGSNVGPLTPALRDLEPASEGVARRGDRLKIILLSQYFPPEVGATQTRMQSFAEHLSARGHQVTVICEFPNHPHGLIPAAYQGQVVEDDRTNDYRVIRVWVKASETKTQRTRMKFYLSYMGMATAVAPLAGRADVVIATTPPLFAAVAGAAISRMNRAPLVVDVRDLWPAAAISLNQLSNPMAARGSELVEQWLYREAAAVVAVTRPFCVHIDRVRARPPSSTLIPNGTLPQFFVSDGPDDATRAALGLPADRFVAMFAGTLGIAQSLLTVLDAAEQTRDEIEYALVGEGPAKAQLQKRAAGLRLTNVHFRPQVPLDAVPQVLAASDALVVTLSGHRTFADFVPSKLIDFLATGRPVVLSAAGEAARIVERSGGGLVVRPDDGTALAEALRHVRDRPAEAAAMGQRGRAFARGRLRSVQAERLEQLLIDTVSTRRRSDR